jgi:hypothetical protein
LGWHEKCLLFFVYPYPQYHIMKTGIGKENLRLILESGEISNGF